MSANLEQGQWLSLSQAAHILGLTPQRVRVMVDEGKLVSTRTPLGRIVDAASVEAERERRVKLGKVSTFG